MPPSCRSGSTRFQSPFPDSAHAPQFAPADGSQCWRASWKTKALPSLRRETVAALPKLTSKAKDGKVPTIDEFAFDYSGPANTFVVENGKFLEDGEMRTVLLQVPPGTYILYGSTLGGRGLVTCNCLGTVRFAAKAGTITDIGSLYVDKVHKPSPVPHLEDNLGPQMFQYGFIFGQALVPADASGPVPAALRGLAVERAQFEAVGQYYEPGAANINRLAPIPGVLSYEKGRPVDVRTGKMAE